VLSFTGFASPVDNDIVNVAKAGQTVPLKFHVSDAVVEALPPTASGLRDRRPSTLR
jgi:hypothetical protein